MWCYWTGKYYSVSFFPRSSGWKNSFKIKKNFLGGYLFQIKSFTMLVVQRRSVWQVYGANFRFTAPGQHSYLRTNVAVMASHWQHCVWFDGPEIRTSGLPLQRRKRHRSINWLVGLSFCICYISSQPQPQNENKKLKNYILILPTGNYCNWLGASLSLTVHLKQSSLERPTLASLFLCFYSAIFKLNECEISNFCL